jgi:hypothetical protein
MLLGFIVLELGIEANPENISVITNMGLVKDIKGVQRVMGCLEALSWFHLTPQRKRLAPIPTTKENRALHLDPRGQGSSKES